MHLSIFFLILHHYLMLSSYLLKIYLKEKVYSSRY